VRDSLTHLIDHIKRLRWSAMRTEKRSRLYEARMKARGRASAYANVLEHLEILRTDSEPPAESPPILEEHNDET